MRKCVVVIRRNGPLKCLAGLIVGAVPQGSSANVIPALRFSRRRMNSRTGKTESSSLPHNQNDKADENVGDRDARTLQDL